MASPWHDIYPEQRGVVSDPHSPARSVLLCLSCGRLPPHTGSEAVCPACAPPTGSCDCPGCVVHAAAEARAVEAERTLEAATKRDCDELAAQRDRALARAVEAEMEAAEVVAGLETLRDHFLAKIEAGEVLPMPLCGWCGMPMTDTEAFRAHALVCEKNPPVQRALAAEAEVVRLSEREIGPLAALLLGRFGGPTQSESACEMAARVLVEQSTMADGYRSSWLAEEGRRIAAEAEAKWAKDLATKWKALSVLQDALLACYRTGRNPGRVLDRLAAARAALKETT